MKKAIFKFNFDGGRQGNLEGIFVATKEQVDTLIEEGINIYFGEVLGKHSEVYSNIEQNEIEFVTDDEKVVNLFIEHNLSSGYNPFDYSPTDIDDLLEEYGLEDSDFWYEDEPSIELVNAIIKKKQNLIK